MELKIKIDVPELVAAVEKLAAAIDKTALNITVPNEGTLNFNTPASNAPVAPAPVQTAPTPAPVAAPAPAPTPAAPPVTPMPTAAAPAPAVPVTAPTYTLDQIAKAGANLVDAGKMEQLLALLTKYGVQAVTQLTPRPVRRLCHGTACPWRPDLRRCSDASRKTRIAVRIIGSTMA